MHVYGLPPVFDLQRERHININCQVDTDNYMCQACRLFIVATLLLLRYWPHSRSPPPVAHPSFHVTTTQLAATISFGS